MLSTNFVSSTLLRPSAGYSASTGALITSIFLRSLLPVSGRTNKFLPSFSIFMRITTSGWELTKSLMS